MNKGLDVGREDQEERDDAEGPDDVQADEEVCATRQREPWPLETYSHARGGSILREGRGSVGGYSRSCRSVTRA